MQKWSGWVSVAKELPRGGYGNSSSEEYAICKMKMERFQVASSDQKDFCFKLKFWEDKKNCMQNSNGRQMTKKLMTTTLSISDILTRSNPKALHVCWTIFWSHRSKSGGGVPAIGWGRGRTMLGFLVLTRISRFLFSVGQRRLECHPLHTDWIRVAEFCRRSTLSISNCCLAPSLK